MYPTRSMMEYMTEMLRLFPEQREEAQHYSSNSYLPTENRTKIYLDVRGQPQLSSNQASLFHSPAHQPAMANHSSSSTDSASPDTFPDLSQCRFYNQFPRQRPIVGRKLLASCETPPKMAASRSFESEFESSTPNQSWHQEDFNLFSTPKHTPPKAYELFPENKDVGFQPITPQPTLSPTSSFYRQPTLSPTSSFHTNTSSSNFSPNKYLETPPRSYQRFPKPPMMAFNTAQSFQDKTGQKMCTFCRKNGETPMVYMNHTVRGRIGNRNIVTCPILRSHVCATCGVSGDNAHTITYCPVLRSNNNGQPLQSTTITLKNTRIKSNGKRRY